MPLFNKELSDTEQAILKSATEIFAAGIAAGQVNDDNNGNWLNASVDAAVGLARRVETVVRGDGD